MPDAHPSTTPRRGGPLSAERRQRLVTATIALLVVALLDGCGSSHPSSPSATATVKQTCRQVEAALSDGPDPEADPVGHAQAQVLPLSQIHTSNERLQQEIDRLASAYRAFSASDGSSSAKSAVRLASKGIEGICPGVAS